LFFPVEHKNLKGAETLALGDHYLVSHDSV
jgi:hypothetical protein